jgi:alanyl-tRNA synthetase
MAGLIPVLAAEMGEAYPELPQQKTLISRVITEEEHAFLRTLETGISRLDQIISGHPEDSPVDGREVFELYDTYGFPPDLTRLILSEKGLETDMAGFQSEMEKQKNRSRQAAGQETEDWTILLEDELSVFTGYDQTGADVRITRYRRIKTQKGSYYQLVFDITPFYAESGGQVGDTGSISAFGEIIPVIDTRKENNLIIHITDKLPSDPSAIFKATVDEESRLDTMRNHSATHLLHFALRSALGRHVEQKGSLVHPDYLRFDFSHYHKMSDQETGQVERIVNQLIRSNISLTEFRNIPMEEARGMGAMALFGEKYGDHVRVIRFGESVELCGGTHVAATGQIGCFRIVTEGSIAAGIRRIEAWTGRRAEEDARENARKIHELAMTLKSGPNLVETIIQIQEENNRLKKRIENFEKDRLRQIKEDLIKRIQPFNGINLICERIDIEDAGQIKDLAFQIKGEIQGVYLVLGAIIDGKPSLSVMISDSLVSSLGLNAGQIVRESAREMEGGGGGQAFFATAGGKDPGGLDKALAKARSALTSKF